MISIRAAHPEDWRTVERLNQQLGYDLSSEALRDNLARILKHADHELVVIINSQDEVLGYMHLMQRLSVVDMPFLQVTAIVTDENHRGKGLGRQLMEYAEHRAREKKLAAVRLYSNTKRDDAHAFYEHIGYHKAKVSTHFRKNII